MGYDIVSRKKFDALSQTNKLLNIISRTVISLDCNKYCVKRLSYTICEFILYKIV